MSGRHRQGREGPPLAPEELPAVEFSGGRAERLVLTPGQGSLEWIDWQGDRLELVLVGLARLEDGGVAGAELVRGRATGAAEGRACFELWAAGADAPVLRAWASAFRLLPRKV